jgi:hypothetical protein
MGTMMAAPGAQPGGPGAGGSVLSAPPPSPRMPIAAIAGQGEGLGPDAGSPEVQALQGLEFMERGAQLLATTFPEMAPDLAQLISGLRQAVPQAMAGGAGGMPGAGAAPQMGGGGMAPMVPPP